MDSTVEEKIESALTSATKKNLTKKKDGQGSGYAGAPKYSIVIDDDQKDAPFKERLMRLAKSILRNRGLEREILVTEDDLMPFSPVPKIERNTATRSKISAESVVLVGRQSLLIVDGRIENPWSYQVKSDLMLHENKINFAIQAVGAVIFQLEERVLVGTAWAIADGIIITNRHVAQECAKLNLDTNAYTMTKTVYINFTGESKNEHDITRTFKVARPLYIATDEEEDFAIFQLDSGGKMFPSPIPLLNRLPVDGDELLCIGFPAEPFPGSASNSTANEQLVNRKIFRGVYNVKRASPGLIMAANDSYFEHDCTTLPGSSGSLLMDMESGLAIGLHFAGSSFESDHPANYAVCSKYLHDRLQNLLAIPQSPVSPPGDSPSDDSFRDVTTGNGYNPQFLMTFNVQVPTPNDELLAETDHSELLRYTNFSILMHKSRRLAIYTAVNIDGENSKPWKRGRDKWSYDARLDEQYQVGNDFYSGSGFDRGHLVRRLDPVWGPNLQEAEQDTFVFTNCSPQWPTFNQQLWLELEDYLLESARTHGFKLSVFTGPIFKTDDPQYRGVQIPRQYWKVAVMISESTKQPIAAAYIISQSELLPPYVEFSLGEFKTYQVSVQFIESKTGLNFGDIKDFDAIHGVAPESFNREIRKPSDMIF